MGDKDNVDIPCHSTQNSGDAGNIAWRDPAMSDNWG
jgi:hypothetical protein